MENFFKDSQPSTIRDSRKFVKLISTKLLYNFFFYKILKTVKTTQYTFKILSYKFC